MKNIQIFKIIFTISLVTLMHFIPGHLSFFFTPSTLFLLGAPHVSIKTLSVVEKLSRSHGVGPQTLRTQCGIYFGASEEVRGVVNVCLAEWT